MKKREFMRIAKKGIHVKDTCHISTFTQLREIEKFLKKEEIEYVLHTDLDRIPINGQYATLISFNLKDLS